MTHRPGPAASARRAAAMLLAAAMLAATAACRGGAGGANEVKALVARQVEAINGRDMQALARIWSQQDDILLFDVAPPGRFKGWTEIARSFNNLFEKAGELHMTVENVQVQDGGTLATATYDWVLSGKVGETPLEDRGEATEIYRHEKDGWKLMHAHYSAVPPGTPAAPAAAAAPEKPAEGKAAGAAAPTTPSEDKLPASKTSAAKPPAAKPPASKPPAAKPSGATHPK